MKILPTFGTHKDAEQPRIANSPLVIIYDDKSIMHFILHIDGQKIYIGLSDTEQQGDMRWVDGSLVTYSNYYP